MRLSPRPRDSTESEVVIERLGHLIESRSDPPLRRHRSPPRIRLPGQCHGGLGMCRTRSSPWPAVDSPACPSSRFAISGRAVLPTWPYNLFCMIHGRDRAAVEQQVEDATFAGGLNGLPRDILFSKRRASSSAAPATAHPQARHRSDGCARPPDHQWAAGRLPDRGTALCRGGGGTGPRGGRN